ncbi:MAG: helix-turn-helix transcriptional regulator [Bacteroidota bacterium]
MTIYKEIQELLTAMDIPERADNPNFFIYRIEDHFGDKPISFGPYKHKFFELTFGSGHDVDIKIGNTDFKPIDDVISFASPFQISSWSVNAFKKDSIGYMMFFKYELLGEHLNKIEFHRRYPFFNLHSTPVFFLSPEQREATIHVMQNLVNEFQKNKPSNEIIIRSYLTILLEKIKEFYNTKSALNGFTSRAEEITFHFENAIKAQTNYKLKIADYASQLHLSGAYLSEAVKAATQRTPHNIIQEYLILQAKSLLNQTNKTIAVIAEDLGFDESSNFVKYFKKAVGTTPHKYRNT